MQPGTCARVFVNVGARCPYESALAFRLFSFGGVTGSWSASVESSLSLTVCFKQTRIRAGRYTSLCDQAYRKPNRVGQTLDPAAKGAHGTARHGTPHATADAHATLSCHVSHRPQNSRGSPRRSGIGARRRVGAPMGSDTDGSAEPETGRRYLSKGFMPSASLCRD